MTSTTGTSSSVHLGERDKILAERHEKVLATLERKVERLKRSNDDTLKQLFEAQTRGNRLAESLGFHDSYVRSAGCCRHRRSWNFLQAMFGACLEPGEGTILGG